MNLNLNIELEGDSVAMQAKDEGLRESGNPPSIPTVEIIKSHCTSHSINSPKRVGKWHKLSI